jgi:DNA polymerase
MAEQNWKTIESEIENCRRCDLCLERNHIVLGDGNRNADVMLVGEGPGGDEDKIGLPFVGKAGQLLDKMLASIDMRREDLYITNVVKCRPPGNRTPMEEEAEACLPVLRMQYALIRPKIIVCLGATATRYLYDPEARITKVRGVWKQKNGVWMLPTYHPAALLRDETKKRDAWNDLQSLSKKYHELIQQEKGN